MRKQSIGKGIVWGVLLAALVFLTNTFAQRSGVFEQLDLLVDVRYELSQHYVEDPDEQAMVRTAIEGMIESLNDPYTSYLPPEDLDRFNRSVQGEYSGIGAEVDVSPDGRPRIVTPLEDSPAWEAGVMAGDVVLGINGERTSEMSLQDAVDKLTGEAGTDVTIRVRHQTGEEETITITRQRIELRTVRGFGRTGDQAQPYMLDPQQQIGYIRISQFTQKTPDEMREALKALESAEPAGLILDLRFNPGGLLDKAVDIAGMFLEEGKRVVSVKGRTVSERVHRVEGEPLMPDVPMVVLANNASASAAEIVTGALKDHGRAHVVGTRTFGKGSVQEPRMLESNQGALKITTAYYYLPSGRNIHRRPDDETWGVDPSEAAYVPMSQQEIRQLINTRREKEALRRGEDASATRPAISAAYLRQNWADPQLAAGYEAITGKLDTGDWPKVGKSGADQLARASERRELRRQRDRLRQQLESVQQRLEALAPGQPSATQPDGGEAATQPAEPADG